MTFFCDVLFPEIRIFSDLSFFSRKNDSSTIFSADFITEKDYRKFEMGTNWGYLYMNCVNWKLPSGNSCEFRKS